MAVEFYQTEMGKRFFNTTLPNLVKQMEKLNENLAVISQVNEKMSSLDEKLNYLKDKEKDEYEMER